MNMPSTLRGHLSYGQDLSEFKLISVRVKELSFKSSNEFVGTEIKSTRVLHHPAAILLNQLCRSSNILANEMQCQRSVLASFPP